MGNGVWVRLRITETDAGFVAPKKSGKLREDPALRTGCRRNTRNDMDDECL